MDTTIPFETYTENPDVPQASMGLRFAWPGSYNNVNDTFYGYVKYTYYVKFRGQTYKD
jgi:hypothetical protein